MRWRSPRSGSRTAPRSGAAASGSPVGGEAAALDVLRGLLVGLFGTAAFYLVIALGVVALGVWLAFTLAIAVTLAIQVVALGRVRAATRLDVEPEPA